MKKMNLLVIAGVLLILIISNTVYSEKYFDENVFSTHQIDSKDRKAYLKHRYSHLKTCFKVTPNEIKPLTLRYTKTKSGQLILRWNKHYSKRYILYIDNKLIYKGKKNSYRLKNKLKTGNHSAIVTTLVGGGTLSSNIVYFTLKNDSIDDDAKKGRSKRMDDKRREERIRKLTVM